MIKRLYISESDRDSLSKCKTSEAKARESINYKNIVVKKPWGYEYLLFENEFVAIWILHIKKGESTSIHCHPNKKTSLLVLSGKILLMTLSDWFNLKTLDGLIIESGVFHSSKAESNGVYIMEIETPPKKDDLIRLKDAYGREGKAYEGKSKMTTNIHKYNHIYFDNNDVLESKNKSIKKVVLKMNSEIDFGKKSEVYVLLKGLIEGEQKENFEVGSIFSIEEIIKYENIRIKKDSLLFTIKKDD